MSRNYRDQLVEAFDFKEFCQGVTLFKEGVPNTQAYLIIKGQVKLLKKSKLPSNARKKDAPKTFKLPMKSDV